jgi:7,8-dihydropterin-6-yl-methyl-4-(beta-D-ribofuranosyl)aminobenzene 5'-phosphate synthase
VVGCSHPGIETILAEAAKIDTRIYTVVGGLHLVDKSDQEVTQTVANLKNKWKAERITAGHCTGELAQTQFEQVFKARHDHPGVGEVVVLPM